MTELLLPVMRMPEGYQQRAAFYGGDWSAMSDRQRKRRALWFATSAMEARAREHFNVNLFHPDTPSSTLNGNHPDRHYLHEASQARLYIPELMMARLALAETNVDVKSLDIAAEAHWGNRRSQRTVKLGVEAVAGYVQDTWDINSGTTAQEAFYMEPGYIPGEPDYVVARHERGVAQSQPYDIKLENIRRGTESHEVDNSIVARDIFLLRIPAAEQFDTEFAEELQEHIGDAKAIVAADGEWRFQRSYSVRSEAFRHEMRRAGTGARSPLLTPVFSTVVYLRRINDRSAHEQARAAQRRQEAEAYFAWLEAQDEQ